MKNTIELSFQDAGVSRLIKDYLDKKEHLKALYEHFPTLEFFESDSVIKRANDFKHRESIVKSLIEQNPNLSAKQTVHIEALKKPNSVTITTGHQLNLMTGPLYFFYKILHTIKLCDTLNSNKNPSHFVPIFWMATEDHDLEEVNHFNLYHKTYRWETKQQGAVGRMQTTGLYSVLESLQNTLPDTDYAKQMIQLFRAAYLEHKSIAEATRYLVQNLLGEFGVLILDADKAELKVLAIPEFKKDLLTTIAQDSIQDTHDILKDYKIQAHVRETNLFYLKDNFRNRIIAEKDGFYIDEQNINFTSDELLTELHNHPERFSPNVILRPLYQEIILPNVCYIGGGGEIAYWLQLKPMFDAMSVRFPALLLRNSFALSNRVLNLKAFKYKLLPNHFFEDKTLLANECVKSQSVLFNELKEKEEALTNLFSELNDLAEKTNPTFKAMLNAQKQKQLNGFKKLEKRLYKAEKFRLNTLTHQLDELYDHFYPNGSWQERRINFIPFYLDYGKSFIDKIYNAMPIDESKFVIVELND